MIYFFIYQVFRIFGKIYNCLSPMSNCLLGFSNYVPLKLVKLQRNERKLLSKGPSADIFKKSQAIEKIV